MEKKKETLEEAAERLAIHCNNDFIKGYKLAQETHYSDIENFINWIDEEEAPREDGLWIQYFNGKDNYLTTKELFERYKKK